MSFIFNIDGQTIRNHSAERAVETVRRLRTSRSQVLDVQVSVLTPFDEEQAVSFAESVSAMTGEVPVFDGTRGYGEAYTLYADLNI